jgi:hypothetical protein
MVGTGVIPASQLVFSAELAETLGLEEAILVQQLRSLYQHLPATTVDGLAWLHVSRAYLQQLMPFWGEADFERISASLEAQGLLRTDRRSAHAGSLFFALDAGGSAQRRAPPAVAPQASARAAPPAQKAAPPTTTSPAESGTARPRRAEGEPLAPDFTPSEDMLELLERFHAVPRDFALRQLEDFTLYWRERGSGGHAWQNKFKQHVLFHWARYQQGRGAGVEHEGQQGTGDSGRTRDRSLEQDLTDTSWAE